MKYLELNFFQKTGSETYGLKYLKTEFACHLIIIRGKVLT